MTRYISSPKTFQVFWRIDIFSQEFIPKFNYGFSKFQESIILKINLSLLIYFIFFFCVWSEQQQQVVDMTEADIRLLILWYNSRLCGGHGFSRFHFVLPACLSSLLPRRPRQSYTVNRPLFHARQWHTTIFQTLLLHSISTRGQTTPNSPHQN